MRNNGRWLGRHIAIAATHASDVSQLETTLKRATTGLTLSTIASHQYRFGLQQLVIDARRLR